MKKSTIPVRLSINGQAGEGSALEILATKILGGHDAFSEPGLKVFQLTNGSLMECYGAGASFHRNVFEKGNLTISFRVPNIRMATEELCNAGAELVNDIISVSNSYSYCHLKFNDNLVLGLYQEN